MYPIVADTLKLHEFVKTAKTGKARMNARAQIRANVDVMTPPALRQYRAAITTPRGE
jgi:hypothetical protein